MYQDETTCPEKQNTQHVMLSPNGLYRNTASWSEDKKGPCDTIMIQV